MRPYLNNVTGKSTSDVITLQGGLNTCYDKTFIKDNQMPYMWNVCPLKSPTLSTRLERMTLAWFLDSTVNYAVGKALALFVSSSKTLYEIEDRGVSNDAQLYKYVPNLGNYVKTFVGNITRSSRYYICECRDAANIYIMISTGSVGYKYTEGGAFVTASNNVGILAGHLNRLWVASGTSLKFSALRDYDDFITNYKISYVNGDTDNFIINQTNFISAVQTYGFNIGFYKVTAANNSGTITTTVSYYDENYWRELSNFPSNAFSTQNINDGEEKTITVTVSSDSTAGEINITNAKGNIVALVPYDGKLIIFCERSWHVLYGSSPNPDVNQFYLVDMNDGLGCISHTTYTICDRKLYWMDTDCNVYSYNGSSVIRVSEPYGSKEYYAQYGGIKDIGIAKTKLYNIRMSSYDSYVYIILTRSSETGTGNDTTLVYDSRNRVWWAEDGELCEITRWDTDLNTPFHNRTDMLVGCRFNGDLVLMNYAEGGKDTLFNVTTRENDEVKIEYAFETKTWVLGSVKHKKSLTNVWFDADAKATVAVCDNWTDKNPWNNSIEEGYVILGELKSVSTHNILSPTVYSHEGGERQRFIIPKMYLQKVNAFSVRVEGKGAAQFYLLEKEWRLK